MRDTGSDRPYFSFVVPAHNMSEYIGRCLDSILTQEFDSLEVIVVDDASEDDTLAIVGGYAEADPRVKVIALEVNSSAHCARYEGVMASAGKYVWMVDGDDEIVSDACVELSRILADTPADIVQFDTEIINDGNLPSARVDNMRRFVAPYNGALEGREILDKCFKEKAYRFNVWNKVFDSDLCKRGFSDMSYRPLPKAQDEYEYFVLAYHAGTYLGVPGRQYYRYHFGSGITGHNTLDLDQFERYCTMAMTLDEIQAFAERASLSEEYAETLKKIKYQLFDDCYSNWMNNVPQELMGAGLDLIIEYWGDSRAIGLIARKSWNTRGLIAKLAASSKKMTVRGRDVKTVATFYGKFRNGGIQRVMSGLMDIWTSMGYRVVLITEEPPTDEDYPTPEGVVREVIPSAEATNSDNYSERSERLAEILRKHSVDAMVYHAWVSNLLPWDMMTCKCSGVSFIVHSHNIFSMPVLRLTRYFYHLQPINRLCDGMIVLSEVDKAYWSIFNDNVHQVVNPFSFNPDDVRQSDLDNNTVLWVGRMSPEKHPHHALEMMKYVLAEVPDAKLVMVGGNNDAMMDSLERKIDELGIRDSVSMEGFKLDVLPYYQQASVFLSTSDYEGYPTTFTEALSAGVPVVTYEMPYLTVVRLGLGVVQVPRRDARSAAREVVRILRDDEYRRKLGDQARECVSQLSGFDFTKAWKSIFDSLSDTHTPKPVDSTDAIMWSTLAEHYLRGVDKSDSLVNEEKKKSGAAEKKRIEAEKKKAENERKRAKQERAREEVKTIEASLSYSFARANYPSRRGAPLLTIIVEVTGGYECALDSVIDQTLRDWKCIVVTAADPAPILARYEHYGVTTAESVETAIRSAKTPYVAVMGSSVELNRRFIGFSLDRLNASSSPSLLFVPAGSHAGASAPYDGESKVLVTRRGAAEPEIAEPVRTALLSESKGLPNGSSGRGDAERNTRVSFVLDCSMCGSGTATAILKSVPEWGELVCFNVPEGDGFKSLREKWWDRRLTLLNASDGGMPLCAVAGCCSSPSIILVNPALNGYDDGFFDAALRASEQDGRIVPDCPGIQKAIGSVRDGGWAFDPYSTVLRRSEVVAGGFCCIDGADGVHAIASYVGMDAPAYAERDGKDGGLRRASPMRRMCPICGGVFEHLLPGGSKGRKEAKCPVCGSMERHRALSLLVKRTMDPALVNPRTLYVNPPASMVPHLKASGIECMGFDGLEKTTWVYDAIILCHQLQNADDCEGTIRALGNRLSKHGALFITVPLKRINGRNNMVERIKTDIFEIMSMASDADLEPELLWFKNAFCPGTVSSYSLGDGAAIVCRPCSRIADLRRSARARPRPWNSVVPVSGSDSTSRSTFAEFPIVFWMDPRLKVHGIPGDRLNAQSPETRGSLNDNLSLKAFLQRPCDRHRLRHGFRPVDVRWFQNIGRRMVPTVGTTAYTSPVALSTPPGTTIMDLMNLLASESRTAQRHHSSEWNRHRVRKPSAPPGAHPV